MTIYGPIKDFASFFSGPGVTPQKVMQDLDELVTAREITLRINSGGGSAFAGLAIFELVRSHGARIISRIDGVAASAASVIAMAGDKIIMGTGAMMMIHNPWMRAEGEAKDLRDAADLLDRASESLINVYQARTKKSREELRDMLAKTTWFTAQEAVAAGFADEIDSKFEVKAAITGDVAVFNEQRFSLGLFAMAPPLPISPVATGGEPEKTPVQPETKEDTETVENLEELKAKHPAIYDAAVQDGVAKERARLQALDDLAMPGTEEMVNKAKYETFATAEATAIAILKADNERRKSAGDDAQADAKDANVNNVAPGAQEPKSDDAQVKEKGAMLASIINKKREEK